MKYNFDQVVDRKNSLSYKWDSMESMFPGEKDLIPMWVADMDFPCPQEIVQAIVDRANHPIYGYGMIPSEVSKLVAEWQQSRNGWTIDPAWVSYSNGIVPALSIMVTAFTKPGDGVIIQPPVYYPFKEAAVKNGRKLVENPLVFDGQRWVIQYDLLEEQAADPNNKILILCNPHNPVGRVFTKEELTKVGEICGRHGVLIASDEIHSDLIYPGNRHIPIACLSEEFAQNSVTAVSPSKTFNVAGLQMSAIIIPNPELKKIFDAELNHHFTYIPALFGVVGIQAAYSHPGCVDWLEQLLDYLWGNYTYLDTELKKRTPKIKCQRPEGTYLLWLDCRELGLDVDSLNDFFIKEAKIGIENGVLFGGDSAGYIRMNIGCPRSLLRRCLDQLEAAYQARAF